MRVVAVGVVAGSAGALLVTRLMTTVVYGVRVTDPLTYVGRGGAADGGGAGRELHPGAAGDADRSAHGDASGLKQVSFTSVALRQAPRYGEGFPLVARYRSITQG